MLWTADMFLLKQIRCSWFCLEVNAGQNNNKTHSCVLSYNSRVFCNWNKSLSSSYKSTDCWKSCSSSAQVRIACIPYNNITCITKKWKTGVRCFYKMIIKFKASYNKLLCPCQSKNYQVWWFPAIKNCSTHSQHSWQILF